MYYIANPWLTLSQASKSSTYSKTTSGQASEIKKATGYIVLPAFSFSVESTTHSRIVAQFLYQASKTFSLEMSYAQPNPFGFTIAVRWRTGRDVWRRKLWADESFVSPVYNQERIHRYFVLEIWAKDVATISNPTNVQLNLSTRSATVIPLTSFLECDLSTYATFDSLSYGAFPWSLPITADVRGPWLSNVGQWAEIGASSSQTAANKFPAGFP